MCGVLFHILGLFVGPFFSTEVSVTANIYMDMLQIYRYPKCSIYNPLFQQAGALPYQGPDVPVFLHTTFPKQQIGRGGHTTWPPISSDVTLLDFFFLWGLRRSLLQGRSGVLKTFVPQTTTIAIVTTEMLQQTSLEVDYRLDILVGYSVGYLREPT